MRFQLHSGFLKEVWKISIFKIIALLYRFKNNLKKKTFSYVLKKTKPSQLELLGDRSFFLDSYQEMSRLLWLRKLEQLAADNSKNPSRLRVIKTTTFKKAAEMKKTQLKLQINEIVVKLSKCLIFLFFFVLKLITHLRPDLKTRIFWDITLIIILTTQMWYIPIYVSFGIANEAPQLNLYFQTVPLIIFTVDIFFNFVTGYYSKGLWVTEKVRIARHYLKKEFWIDMITLIPLYMSYCDVWDELLASVFKNA